MFLLVSVCCDTAQALVFLLVSVCCDAAQAKVWVTLITNTQRIEIERVFLGHA